MKFGKRHVIMAGLVIALGAAVYLNWQFSDNTKLLTASSSSVTTSKELGQAQFVNNSTDSKTESQSTEGSSSAVKTEAEAETEKGTATTEKNSEEYFAQAKTDRQQAQDEVSELAKEILESAESNDAAKVEAVAHAAELAQVIEQQSNIENLIKAKGFSDCLVFIQNEECSIVVEDNELTDDEALIIKDIASGQSGLDFSKIKITAV